MSSQFERKGGIDLSNSVNIDCVCMLPWFVLTTLSKLIIPPIAPLDQPLTMD